MRNFDHGSHSCCYKLWVLLVAALVKQILIATWAPVLGPLMFRNSHVWVLWALRIFGIAFFSPRAVCSSQLQDSAMPEGPWGVWVALMEFKF